MHECKHILIFVFSPAVVKVQVQNLRYWSLVVQKSTQHHRHHGIASRRESIMPSVTSEWFTLARYMDSGNMSREPFFLVQTLRLACHLRNSCFQVVHVIHFNNHALLFRVWVESLIHMRGHFFPLAHLPLIVGIMLSLPILFAYPERFFDKGFQSYTVFTLGEAL